jgi:iron complex transport system substrate-binding protein
VRIVSLLPSATEIVFALGLGDELVGRTHECDYPPEVGAVPVMTVPAADDHRAADGPGFSVPARLHGGAAVHGLDAAALAAAAPDLILTESPCSLCLVAHTRLVAAARRLGEEVTVVSLEPGSIEGILNSISTVGAMTEAEDEAVGLIEILRERLGLIENRVLERRLQGIAPRRVVCLEWLEPPFAAGFWVPEQVRRAGGWELLGRERERPLETTWEALREVDPEQLLLMPHEMDAAATRRAWERVVKPAGLESLRAIGEGEVYALDGAAYFGRPGPRVIEGIGLLAEIMDPDGFVDQAPPGGWIPLAV